MFFFFFFYTALCHLLQLERLLQPPQDLNKPKATQRENELDFFFSRKFDCEHSAPCERDDMGHVADEYRAQNVTIGGCSAKVLPSPQQRDFLQEVNGTGVFGFCVVLTKVLNI